jgi:prepilin peptidase CpaA
VIGHLSANQWAAILISVVATACDLRNRRIPNSVTFGAALLSIAVAFASSGLSGVSSSVLGWIVGCAMFLPFFALGGLGAGDVKLAAGIGAWLSAGDAFWMALYAMVAGGVLGVVVALMTGYFRQAADNVRLLLIHWRVAGIRPLPEMTLAHGRGPRLPYAVPIAAGTLLTVLWR